MRRLLLYNNRLALHDLLLMIDRLHGERHQVDFSGTQVTVLQSESDACLRCPVGK